MKIKLSKLRSIIKNTLLEGSDWRYDKWGRPDWTSQGGGPGKKAQLGDLDNPWKDIQGMGSEESWYQDSPEYDDLTSDYLDVTDQHSTLGGGHHSGLDPYLIGAEEPLEDPEYDLDNEDWDEDYAPFDAGDTAHWGEENVHEASKPKMPKPGKHVIPPEKQKLKKKLKESEWWDDLEGHHAAGWSEAQSEDLLGQAAAFARRNPRVYANQEADDVLEDIEMEEPDLYFSLEDLGLMDLARKEIQHALSSTSTIKETDDELSPNLSDLEDEDGIDGPWEKAMSKNDWDDPEDWGEIAPDESNDYENIDYFDNTDDWGRHEDDPEFGYPPNTPEGREIDQKYLDFHEKLNNMTPQEFRDHLKRIK